MRLLFLTHEPPLPLVSGARLRSYHLMRELAARGHDVSLMAIATEEVPADARAALERLCERVELVPFRVSRIRRLARLAVDYAFARPFQERYFLCREGLDAVDRIVAGAPPDATVVGQLYTAPYLAAAGPAPIVFDSHNVEERRVATMVAAGGARAIAARRMLRAVARHEASFVAAAGRTWAVSDVEREHFAQVAPGRVDLVPNGVDAAATPMRDRVPDDGDVLFLGRMDYGPNVDGARHLLVDVLPHVRTGPRVRVVGANPPPAIARLAAEAPLPVEVTGYVEETAPYLAAARLLAVSLRSGGGTRLKILEAMAAGVPVVTTSLGGEGLGLVDGRHALVADAPRAFAAAIDRLVTDDDLCARLATEGRALVEERYDWRAIGEAADRSLRALLLRT